MGRFKKARTGVLGTPKRTFYSWNTRKNTNTVNFENISLIERNTLLSGRERDEVIVSGVKMRLNLHCFHSASGVDFYYNWAFIQFKQRNDTSALPTQSEIQSNIFRGATATRARNFNVISNSAEKRSWPINSDKYDVLARGEVHLPQDVSTTHVAKNFKTVQKYIPFNRKMRFNDTGNYTASNPIVFVSWITYLVISSTSVISVTKYVQEEASLIVYHKDVV